MSMLITDDDSDCYLLEKYAWESDRRNEECSCSCVYNKCIQTVSIYSK